MIEGAGSAIRALVERAPLMPIRIGWSGVLGIARIKCKRSEVSDGSREPLFDASCVDCGRAATHVPMDRQPIAKDPWGRRCWVRMYID